ncbi:MAG: hypothetical protein KC501_31565 [Myxococcales bacterium]|nr:hypothetical protein [Myxococcales bacterium]
MATGRLSAERALIGTLVALVLAGVVEPPRALEGLSNAGVATVALLFVVAAAVRRSGALGLVLHWLLGNPRGALAAQLRLTLPVAGLSAFLNNTPIVAMLLPDVRRWGEERSIAPSYLLMPLSFAAIVGGMCTLVGTSTNLLVDGLLIDRGEPSLGIFWISPVGVPAAVVALVVMALVGRRLLPGRAADELPLADPRRFYAEVKVDPSGPLVSRRLDEIRVPGLKAFAPIELRRGSTVISAPRGDQVLAAGDSLLFTAAAAEVLELRRVSGLSVPQRGTDAQAPRGPLAEVVVGRGCPLVGHSVGDGSFRRHYGAAVLAVARDGERTEATAVASWTLEAGDILLLEASAPFIERHRFGGDLVLVSDHGHASPHAPWHAPFSLAVVLAMAGLAASGAMSMLMAALAAAGAMLLARVATWDELANDIEWRVLLAIVGALGLGAALTDTGAAATLAHGLVALGGSSPWLVLALVYLATVITTELVTNNAAAVLVLPIGLDAAATLGVSWLPFVAVVMIGASASFVTPIGYQTNLMVMGPGGYRFGDFARFGAPVALAVGATTLGLAPWLWPF